LALLSGEQEESLMEAQLRAAEARYRALVDHLPAVVYIAHFGTSGRWSYVSPQIEHLLGFTVEEWLGDPELWFKQIHPDDQQQELTKEDVSRSTGAPLSTEYRMMTRRGALVWVRDEAFVVKDDRGEPLFLQGVMTNVTTRKELEEQLRHQAFHDALTGVANRALFSDRVQQGLARSARHGTYVAIALLDIDDFKAINDGFGHPAGDSLLVEVATRLTESVRPLDTVARMGGDEFAMLFEDVNDESLASIAQRIMDVLCRPFDVEGKIVSVHSSIGIAHTRSGEENPEDLLRKADMAMYRAKKEGGNRYNVSGEHTHLAAPGPTAFGGRLGERGPAALVRRFTQDDSGPGEGHHLKEPDRCGWV
jgi:diguanylate cyclase (GGDEF)-like protein/PAS domain S-box-containing protein